MVAAFWFGVCATLAIEFIGIIIIAILFGGKKK